MKTNALKLIFSIIICQAAGALGSFFTVSAIDNWYQFLNKPSFSPPNWLFGPVWVTLYLMMAVSVYLIWKQVSTDNRARQATLFFWIHLAFNASWSLVFFGLRNPGLALLNIAVLWFFIALVMIRFHKIKPVAAYLLVPYFLWVSFASVLNFAIWILN